MRSSNPLLAAALFAIAPLLVAAGCQKTPDEPSPPPRAPAATEASMPKPEAANACPSDPENGGPKLAVADVKFPGANGVVVHAELARTRDETTRGLMYRTKMPEENGMLFRMGRSTVQEFWMRNTCISLDMLFIEDDGTIVGIVENVPTLNDKPRGVGKPSSWVLEVNGGWSGRHGVKAGQKIAIPPEARKD